MGIRVSNLIFLVLSIQISKAVVNRPRCVSPADQLLQEMSVQWMVRSFILTLFEHTSKLGTCFEGVAYPLPIMSSKNVAQAYSSHP